jgi:hypothetical protein
MKITPISLKSSAKPSLLMSEDKGFGSKLLGLFVEVGDKPKGEEDRAQGDTSPADVVAQLAKSTTPGNKPVAPAPPGARPAPTPQSPAMPKPTGPVTPATIDFDAVFRQAGVDAQELDRVRKAEDLLKSLPESTPADVKRQIVEASLKAFGVDVAKIAASAQNQLKAIDTFMKVNEQQTAKALGDAQAQIAKLEDTIIGLKVEIDKRTANVAATGAAADVRRAEVKRVLEFFAPSSAATP